MATHPQGETDILTAEASAQAVATLQQAPELAVDVEADAMHAYRARLCYVQVGTDEDIFLFDTLVPEVRADALAPLFGDPNRTKFFHAAGGDLQYLTEAGVRVKGLFDTHRAATLLGWAKVGLADLARELLSIELAKEHQQSDFSVRPLPSDIRAYIANDVRYLCEIGRQVREACRTADILEEVALDCVRLCDEAEARPDQAEFKPKLPRGSLSANQLALAHAVAVQLHPLRLKWAEAANVPMGRMLSNAAIQAIALRPPADLRELAKREGVRGPFVREHGEEVLALIRGLIEQSRRGELKPDEASSAPRDPQRRKREETLKAWRAEMAKLRKVTGSVVLTNPLVDALAANPPADLDTLRALPYFGEKRVQLYGEKLIALLARPV